MVVMGMGEEDAGEREAMPLEIAEGREVRLRIHDRGFFLPPIQDQVNEVAVGPELVLRDCFIS